MYKNLLTDTITYWAPGALDGYGTRAYAAPVQLKARYEYVKEEIIDDQGQTFLAVGRVYTLTQLAMGGWVSNSTVTSTGPESCSTAFRIAKLTTSSNPKKSITVYKADLK